MLIATLYCVLSVVLIALAFRRPIWAVGYYLLNFFAFPKLWYWGASFPQGVRYSLIAGCVLLLAVLVHEGRLRLGHDKLARYTSTCSLLYLGNAFLVLLLFSYDWTDSWNTFVELAKFVLLVYLISSAARTANDFRLFLLFLTFGILYWGLEAKFGRITILHGRLEDFGGPGCAKSNELASIVITLLPLCGAMIFSTSGKMRVVVALSAAFGLNLLLLCNSRAAFLALLATAISVVIFSPARVRRTAITGLAWAALALFLLLGNPKIMERFLTTFHDRSEARNSAESRIAYASAQGRIGRWKAAWQMIEDYPLGSGGNSFMAGKGDPYLAKMGHPPKKSIHDGFLRDACDWGIQGLALHLMFITTSAVYVLQTIRSRQLADDASGALLGVCVLAGMVGFLVTCKFGDLLHLEWGYWIVVVAVLYGRTYGSESTLAGAPDDSPDSDVTNLA